MQEHFMSLALKEAQKAFERGEVPVGAVVVKDGKVLAKACNERESKQNIICHAEILALQKACEKIGTTHLEGCEMYVTLEPCPMCSGALVASRLDKVYFGTSDDNYGCGGSVYNFFDEPKFEGRTLVIGGVLESQAKKMLQDFFKIVRDRNKSRNFIGKKLDCTKLDRGDIKSNSLLGKVLANAKQSKIKRFSLVSHKDIPVLSFGEGEITAIVQDLNSFEYFLVQSSSDSDTSAFLKHFLSGIKCKIVTKSQKIVCK